MTTVSRRGFLGGAVTLGASALASGDARAAMNSAKPNIVFILADCPASAPMAQIRG